jgi:glycosyltransferase involved in cell wall biosynthesis
MKFKNLLIISNNFPDKMNEYIGDIFVKEQLDYLKYYFDNVYVIIPVPFGIEYLRKTTHKNYKYDNVNVYFPKYFNYPFFYFFRRDIWLKLEKKAILKLIQKENLKFDLIHAHFTWPSGSVAVELKKVFEVPVVITEHSHITLHRELKRKNKQYIKTLTSCDAIIRVNKKDIPLFIEAGVSPDRIFHVANGYSPNKFKIIFKNYARAKLGLSNSTKLVLNIGRLSEEKGQKYLIEAVKNIIACNDDVLVIIGGTGPLKNKLDQKIKDFDLQNNIKLIGFIPDDLISIWMNACDLFVLPSLSESFGIVQIEALSCGKPVIATRNGASEEIIINDKLGILVEPKDSEDLKLAIQHAFDTKWDEDYIRNYVDRFTWANIAKKIMKVYEKLS